MSDKPVLERLQVKGPRRLAVIGAPDQADLALGGTDVRARMEDADIVLVFAADRARLDEQLESLLSRARSDAILWIAYPKLTSALAGDLSRDVIRDAVSAHRLDTVSQIAIDADWSAMRVKRVG